MQKMIVVPEWRLEMRTLEEVIEGTEVPGPQFFRTLGDAMALRYNPSRGFYHKNLDRGVLLCCLVAECGAKRVLEFGTGRGYGALCAAAARRDYGREGWVTSIDIWPTDKMRRTAVIGPGGPEIRRTSVDELTRNSPTDLLNRVFVMKRGGGV